MFFKRNTPVDEDAEQLTYVTSVLNVSVYRLFELAYEDWFGESANEGYLEAVYMPYVVLGTMPVWLRNYVRKTAQLCDEAGMYVPRTAAWPNPYGFLNVENAIITLGLVLIVLLIV